MNGLRRIGIDGDDQIPIDLLAEEGQNRRHHPNDGDDRLVERLVGRHLIEVTFALPEPPTTTPQIPVAQIVAKLLEPLDQSVERKVSKGLVRASHEALQTTEDPTIELGAVKRVLGDDLSGASMSSTKSAIGHLLGGAGAVEAIFCILAIRDQIVPPTLNLDNPDEGTEGVDLVPKQAKQREVRAALNNSFGFGGTNASLIVQKVD